MPLSHIVENGLWSNFFGVVDWEGMPRGVEMRSGAFCAGGVKLVKICL